jgi:PKD repeat protein
MFKFKKLYLIQLRITILILLISTSGWSQIVGTPSSGCAPLINVNFNAGNPTYTNVSWNFGDGASSINLSPYHTYANPGLYTVHFSANLDSIVVYDTLVITVYENPLAGFQLNTPAYGCAPYNVIFEDTSLAYGASIVQRNWTFGDGSMSMVSSSNADHTYLNQGIYDVSLEIVDDNGCEDFILLDSLIYISTYPYANISSNFGTLNNCIVPMLITFNGTSNTSSILADTLLYSWNFNNGINSDSINNTILFDVGSYTVSLTVEDTLGCSHTAYEFININDPFVNFTLSNSTNYTICGLALFQNLSSFGNAFWEYGDGTSGTENYHNYSIPGIYDVMLTVTEGNCSIDTTIPILVEDIEAKFSVDKIYSCSSPLLVQFTDSSTNAVLWEYDFDDGDSGFVQNPVHQYINADTGLYDMPHPQVFVPNLTAISPNGCEDKYSSDTIILDMPVAWFMPNIVTGFAPLTVTFSDSSYAAGNIISWYWDFGDGTDSLLNVDVVDHTFTQPGQYDVILTIVNDLGCGDISWPVTIYVEPASPFCGGT